LFVTRPRTVHVFCENLSAVDELVCNPKPKSGRQTGRYPFNAGQNDLAKDTVSVVGIFVASDDLVKALAQQRQAGVTHTRIIAIITDALCQSASESIPLIKSSQRQQAGISGDLTARKIGSNGAVSVEGKRKLWYITRCHV